MPEYLVFPIPNGLMRVQASNPNAARNKYVKASKEIINEALIIIPNNFGNITKSELEIEPLHRITIPKLE